MSTAHVHGVSTRDALTLVTFCTGAAALVGVIVGSASTMILAVGFSLLLLGNLIVDVGVWRRAHEHDDLDTTEDTVARERKIGMRTAARIGLMLLLAVFIITAISVGWRATFVGTAFVFCAVVAATAEVVATSTRAKWCGSTSRRVVSWACVLRTSSAQLPTKRM